MDFSRQPQDLPTSYLGKGRGAGGRGGFQSG